MIIIITNLTKEKSRNTKEEETTLRKKTKVYDEKIQDKRAET